MGGELGRYLWRGDIAGWEATYAAVRAVAGVVDDCLEYLTCVNEFSRRQVAAVYLARCPPLVEGMDRLRSKACSISPRSRYGRSGSGWVRGMYVLLGGEAAVDELIANYKWEAERQHRLAGLKLHGIEQWRGRA